MIVLMVVVEYTTRVVTLWWMCMILCGVSGCDDFQCDREIRFLCDPGQCGIIIDGGRWMYVVGYHKNLPFSPHTYVSASSI